MTADTSVTSDGISRLSFIRGFKHAGLNGFYGFLIGEFISVVSGVVPNLSSSQLLVFSFMPLIGLMGGVAFGFGTGMDK